MIAPKRSVGKAFAAAGGARRVAGAVVESAITRSLGGS
jgi:hypothetical protein